LCCAPGKLIGIATKAAARVVVGMGQGAALAAVRAAAAEMGIGLTPLETVIQRAFAAVETVNLTVADFQKTGGMREMNAEFKAARKAGTVVRYHDFLHAKKLAMPEAIAGQR